MEKGSYSSSVIHLFITVFSSNFAGFIVSPAITDVTMNAVCPGKDECSLAIYLSGFQQAVSGLGMVLFTPLIGNLSDKYGRKALLTLPVTAVIIPSVILAYSRETNFFYAYYIFKTLTSMIGDASISCLALAFLADNTREDKRASAFGILSGVSTAGFVCATLSSRFLSEAQTFQVISTYGTPNLHLIFAVFKHTIATMNGFQVGAIVSMITAVYMRIFLKDTKLDNDGQHQDLLSGSQDLESTMDVQEIRKIPTIQDIVTLFQGSKIISQAAVVVFFNSLADGGLLANILYYLKARFHYNKDQYADIYLIGALAGSVSLLFVMPVMVQAVGPGKLLSFSLLYAFANWAFFSISWSPWVPYALAVNFFFMYLPQPCVRSIVSNQVGPHEQGKVQGCISGISALTGIVAPLVFSPLTALFLSDQAPFYYPGFSVLCIGSMNLIAFVQSLMMKSNSKPTTMNSESSSESHSILGTSATPE